MTLIELEKSKSILLNKVNPLIALKKKLYSNMDIASPMSAEEKALNNEISNIFSEIDKIIRQKRAMKSSSLIN